MTGVPATGDLFAKPGGRRHGKRLRAAAHKAVHDVLALRPEERVVVVTNPGDDVFPVAEAVHDAARANGNDVLLLVQPVRDDGAWMDPGVLRVLEQDPEVVITILEDKLGLDPERTARPILGKYRHYVQYMIGEGRSRGFWSPGVNVKTFEKLVDIDYVLLRDEARATRDLLADAEELRITTAAGTDLMVPIDGSRVDLDDGDLRVPGRGGNLPCGEVLVPVLRTPQAKDAEGDGAGIAASGRLVLDGPVKLPREVRAPKRAIEIDVEQGLVTRIGEGADAEALRGMLQEATKHAEAAVRAGQLTRDEATVFAGNARRIAEIGIGLHPAARVTGDRLVDDKARGAVHLSFGAAHDELPPGSPVAVNAGLVRPTVIVVYPDGSETTLVSEGRLRDVVALARERRAMASDDVPVAVASGNGDTIVPDV